MVENNKETSPSVLSDEFHPSGDDKVQPVPLSEVVLRRLKDQCIGRYRTDYSDIYIPSDRVTNDMSQEVIQRLKDQGYSDDDIRNGSLKGADLSGAILSGVDLRYFDLSGSTLTGADLSKSDLTLAILTDADLTKANLSDAWLMLSNLTNTILIGANMERSVLVQARIMETIMSSANMKDADLSGAQLIRGIFFRTNLSGANLSGLNFQGCNLIESNLDGAKISSSTRFSAESERWQHLFLSFNNDVAKITPKSVWLYELKPTTTSGKTIIFNLGGLPQNNITFGIENYSEYPLELHFDVINVSRVSTHTLPAKSGAYYMFNTSGTLLYLGGRDNIYCYANKISDCHDL